MHTISWTPENDQKILTEIRSNPPPALILIAGASCSGKTLFTDWLASGLKDCAVIHMDDYFLDINDPNLPPPSGYYPSYEVPEAYKLDELEGHLNRVLSGEDVWLPLYDVAENRRLPGGQFLSPDKTFYLVEGLYAFHLGLEGYRVFMDSHPDILRKRRISRDIDFLPDISEEKITRYYDDGVARAFVDFVLPQIRDADFVIDSNTKRR